MAGHHLVHFLRHGQFVADATTGDGPLTALGRRQASRTATRLNECTIARVYSSDLQRAKETARIIAKQLSVSVSVLPMLSEIIPTRIPGLRVPLRNRRMGKEKIEEVIAHFLTSSPRSGDLVVVCHGNFIRAIVCRILKAPVTNWQQLGIFHCGITTFRFKKNGQILLQCFNDTGHLPSKLRTSM